MDERTGWSFPCRKAAYVPAFSAVQPEPVTVTEPLRAVATAPSAPAAKALALGFLLAICFIAAALSVREFVRARTINHPVPPARTRIDSVAVLPLTSLARTGDDDYFSDGVTEELINELAKMGSFRVISRTSVMRYKRTSRPVPEIGRDLDVDAVVEGTVRRSGDRVRITVQLVQTSPERQIWADAFDGDIHDFLSLQRDVATDIAHRIKNKLASPPEVAPDANKRLDPKLYEDYLRGRHFLANRNAEALTKAAASFQRVVDRDPNYARAWAGLSETYNLLGMYEFLPPDESFRRAKGFAAQALRLDDTLADAYTARAVAADYWEFDWAAAEQDFQHALSLNPNSASAHHWYGEYFTSIGNPDRAVSELKLAREYDPLSLTINATLGRMYRDAHRYAEAVEQCNKTVELDPNHSMGHWCLGQTYIGEQRYSAAVVELERATALGPTPLINRDLAYAYAALGKDSRAEAILKSARQESQSRYFAPYRIAVLYGVLGHKDEALMWLQRAYKGRDCSITYLALDPELDPLRSDPRFPLIMKRLKLPR